MQHTYLVDNLVPRNGVLLYHKPKTYSNGFETWGR